MGFKTTLEPRVHSEEHARAHTLRQQGPELGIAICRSTKKHSSRGWATDSGFAVQYTGSRDAPAATCMILSTLTADCAQSTVTYDAIEILAICALSTKARALPLRLSRFRASTHLSQSPSRTSPGVSPKLALVCGVHIYSTLPRLVLPRQMELQGVPKGPW